MKKDVFIHLFYCISTANESQFNILNHIVKLQVQSSVQVKVLVKVQCPVHGQGPGLNSGAQNSVSNSQKKGPGETL